MTRTQGRKRRRLHTPCRVFVHTESLEKRRLFAAPVDGMGIPPIDPSEVIDAGTLVPADQPQAVITAMQQSVMAGQAVHVNAVSSLLGEGAAPTTTRFDWDFGDPDGAYNALTGFNAAHVYDAPGQYVITLTVTNVNRKTSTTQYVVDIAADTRKVIYVDRQTGLDSNDGLTEATAVATPDRAMRLVRDDTTVLFRRGQKFDIAASLTINNSNVFLGAYGEGDRPILNRVIGSGRSTIHTYANAKNVMIEGLTFDSPFAAQGDIAPKIDVSGIYTDGTNITVRDCEFLNVGDALNANEKPVGLLMQDNVAPLVTGIRGYFVWAQGTDLVLLGNRVTNSTREHIFRCSSQETERVLMAFNTFDNKSRRGVDPDDYNKTTINLRAGRYFYIVRNELDHGAIATGASDSMPDEFAAQYIVMQANRIHATAIEIYANTWDMTIVNNLLDQENSEQIRITPTDPAFPTRDVRHINITNNTGINTSDKGKFIKLTGPAADGAVVLANNLYVAPNLAPGGNFAAGVEVQDNDLSSFAFIGTNVWPAPVPRTSANGGVNFVSKLLSTVGYLTPQQWGDTGVVYNDSFQKIELSDTYQVYVNGIFVGSSLSVVPLTALTRILGSRLSV